MAIEFFLASVRLYAVGAKTLELQGPCCGAVFFLRRKAAEEKKGLGPDRTIEDDRRRSKTITKVEELTQRKSAQPTETFGASCCSRVGRCCFSTANWKGTTGYTLFLSNAFLVYAVPPSAATMPHTLPGRLVRPEAQFHQLAGICFRFRTRRQGS